MSEAFEIKSSIFLLSILIDHYNFREKYNATWYNPEMLLSVKRFKKTFQITSFQTFIMEN